MIEILIPSEVKKYQDIVPDVMLLKAGWNYVLDYPWVCKRLADHFGDEDGKRILDVGTFMSRLPDYLEDKWKHKVTTVDRQKGRRVDMVGEFLEINFSRTYDAVIWVSSIEHNKEQGEIIDCWRKSVDLLEPGGIFLATFAISTKTEWFSKAEQWNFTLEDAKTIFDEDEVQGDVMKAVEQYRVSRELQNRYIGRFGSLTYFPRYIVAGVVKVKEL